MKFIDFFSGVGGFTRGLELAGHECVGHCEFDKFAEASYRSMHTITDKQRNYLLTLTLKQRQKEILKDAYLNKEWYRADIRTVRADDMPQADCWTFGAPCQDFSLAGKRAGLNGDRSSLVGEIFRILEETEEENRPEWLIYENVKGMLSSNRGFDYLKILFEMDRLGYDIEWQNINSKWFVPQNRERIYTIGHLRGRRRRKILPIEGTGGENNIEQIGRHNGQPERKHPSQYRVYSTKSISPTLCTMTGGNLEPMIGIPFGIDKSCNSPRKIDIANCITAREDNGVSNHKAEGTAVAIHVLTPDRGNKRQNGRRFKENGEPSFTLTAQDRHGVAIDLKALSSKTRGQAFRYGYAACLDHNCHQGVIVEITEAYKIWAIWSDKYNCYLSIRKLTPRECFRLQGWEDKYFERAEQFNSNSQLYKQAGNGVTVNVTKAIGEKITGNKKLKIGIIDAKIIEKRKHRFPNIADKYFDFCGGINNEIDRFR